MSSKTMAVPTFDYQAEFDLLMTREGQRATPNDGVSREQIQRLYVRRDAHDAAARTRYQDGSTVKEAVDQAIADGHTRIERAARWLWLCRDDESRIRFSVQAERDYILLALDHPTMQRNY